MRVIAITLVSLTGVFLGCAAGSAQRPAGTPAGSMSALGWTDLHAAAADGRTSDVQELLARGDDPNAHESQGATPLHLACTGNSNDATVEALLARGAEVGAVDVFGATALHWAALYSRAGAARLLLDAGAEVNARAGEQAFTAMHAAAVVGDLETLELLLQRGADLAARDRAGRTPLGAAAQVGNDSAAERLRRAGAEF